MNMAIEMASGGCQCGAVRYRAVLQAETAHICHCRMCQKAMGNAYAPLVSAATATLTWTRGAPATFRSSATVDRGFCATCGTPLFYRATDGSDTALTIGSLDDPALAPPLHQYGMEAELAWARETADLPQSGTTEETMADAVDGIRASNRQHPDHDTEAWA